MEFKKIIDELKPEIIKSTQEVIQIKSVEELPLEGMPFGKGPYDALEYMIKLGEKLGFEVKNFDGYAGHVDFGQGEETVGVLAHLDVVPEGDGWTYPPYSGEIHDDKIYGRGTIDNKGPAVAALYSMKAIKDSGVKLNKKIRLILGTNEESRWDCMKHYFSLEKAPDMAFTPDADFPVIYGEKGIIGFDLVFKTNKSIGCDVSLVDIKGGTAINMVPDYAKALLKVKDKEMFFEQHKQYVEKTKENISIREEEGNILVESKGQSAHGSTPEKGENAISYLMKFLGVVYSGECSICRFINLYNERIGFKHNGEGIGCGLEDEISGKLNFNPGLIELKDGKIILKINVRYPITSSSKLVYDGIRDNLKNTPIELIEGDSDSKPLYVPKDNVLVNTLMKVYQEETGDYDSQPITIGGGTYARAMDNAVAFGPVFPGQVEVAHQKDEYITIENLVKLTQIYTKALYELAK